MNLRSLLLAVALHAPLAAQTAQDAAPADSNAAAASAQPLAQAAASVQANLAEAVAELDALRQRITDEKLPLTRRLSELESQLTAARASLRDANSRIASASLVLTNSNKDKRDLEATEKYLGGILGDYVRKFDASLHIAEQARFSPVLGAATLAPDNDNFQPIDVFRTQVALLEASLGRIEEAAGGVRFQGEAVDRDGALQRGDFIQLGPVVLFRSSDGQHVGTVEERLGSSQPTIFPFADPVDIADATALFASGAGLAPIDPTMGDAHKMEQTKETLVEHILKGGPVMWPILGLAGAALLVALAKWLHLALQRTPSQSKVAALLAAVGQNDPVAIRERASQIKGPVGRMVLVAVEHIKEPRELIEEAMFECVLTTKQSLNSFLPFVAIAASSAPLLGLLGTVTGIINTFKRITVFGSGDVKSLSGGISEALITTEFGLIVAIPSLLFHAFLSRKARGIVGRMESTAVAFVNELSRAQLEKPAAGKTADRRPVAATKA